MSPLASLRRTGGADAVAAAITAALARYGTVTAAAAALGTTASNLRASARRCGVPWEARPAGRPVRKVAPCG